MAEETGSDTRLQHVPGRSSTGLPEPGAAPSTRSQPRPLTLSGRARPRGDPAHPSPGEPSADHRDRMRNSCWDSVATGALRPRVTDSAGGSNRSKPSISKVTPTSCSVKRTVEVSPQPPGGADERGDNGRRRARPEGRPIEALGRHRATAVASLRRHVGAHLLVCGSVYGADGDRVSPSRS